MAKGVTWSTAVHTLLCIHLWDFTVTTHVLSQCPMLRENKYVSHLSFIFINDISMFSVTMLFPAYLIRIEYLPCANPIESIIQ